MSGSPDSAAYGLDLNARCIAPVYIVEDDGHRFIAGTAGVKDNNKIHLLEYKEDEGVVNCISVWNHPQEMFSLCTSPSQTTPLFAAIHASSTQAGEKACSIYNMTGAGGSELKRLVELPVNAHKILWDPQGLQDSVVALAGSDVCVLKLDSGLGSSKVAVQMPLTCQRMPSASWDPHHSELVACCCDTSLVKVDMRQKNKITIAEMAHSHSVRDVEYSPNRMYFLTTSGDDGQIKFWDLRNTGTGPVVSRDAHDHWIHRVQYNPYHDQLLISCSSDHTMKLWNLPALSSAYTEGVAPPKNQKEGVIRTVKDFGDSVLSLAWSGSGPWVYAGISYNGKVLVEQVPQDLKLSIIMSRD